MAKVFIACATRDSPQRPYATADYFRMKEAAKADERRHHQLVESEEQADLVLFVGSDTVGAGDVRSHPLYRANPARCFLFDSSDRTLPVVRGIYASAEKSWFPRSRFRAGFYLRTWQNDALEYTAADGQEPYLFSFIGAGDNSPVRQSILRIRDERGYIRDTSHMSLEARQTDGRQAGAYSANYAQVLRQSQFVLCPRGRGTSSWRLFETMMSGRVPVILSDSWVEPKGPQWHQFSLRIAERKVDQLPQILRNAEHRAMTMGLLARRAWTEHFSRTTSFHTIVEWCLEIQGQRSPSLGTALLAPHLLRPFFLRHWVLHLARARLARRG